MTEIKFRFQDGDQAICTASIEQLNSIGIGALEDKFSNQVVIVTRWISIVEPYYKVFAAGVWFTIPEKYLSPLPALTILQLTQLN